MHIVSGSFSWSPTLDFLRQPGLCPFVATKHAHNTHTENACDSVISDPIDLKFTMTSIYIYYDQYIPIIIAVRLNGDSHVDLPSIP